MSRGEVIERTHTFCMHALTVLSLANTDAHFGRVFYMHAKTHTGSSSWEIVHAFSFFYYSWSWFCPQHVWRLFGLINAALPPQMVLDWNYTTILPFVISPSLRYSCNNNNVFLPKLTLTVWVLMGLWIQSWKRSHLCGHTSAQDDFLFLFFFVLQAGC